MDTGKKLIKIIMGLKNNQQCRYVKENFESHLIHNLGDEYIVNFVFSKTEFSDAVRGKQYDIGVILEKVDDTAIGKGAIKNWKMENPEMRIILVMDIIRKASAKSKGLYDMGYYDGLFVDDMGTEVLLNLLINPRTEQQAYDYYDLKNFIEEYKKNVPVEESSDSIQSEVSENNTDQEKESFVSYQMDIKSGESLQNQKRMHSVGAQGEDKYPESENGKKISNKEDVGNLNFELEASTKYEKELQFSDASSTEEAFPVKEKKHETEVLLTNKSVGKKSILSKLKDKEYLANYVETTTETQTSAVLSVDKENDVIMNLFSQVFSVYSYEKEASLNEALNIPRNRDSFDYEVFDFIEEELKASVEDKKLVFEQFKSFTWGYDILELLIKMDGITDIHVLDYNKIRIKKGNERMSVALSFLSPTHYNRFVKNLELRNAGAFTWDDGMTKMYSDHTFSQDYTLQVSIGDGSVDSAGARELLIVKHPKKKMLIPQMIGKKLTLEAAAVLINAIQTGKGILLCGPKGCGATTLLNGMLEYIPLNKNGVAIQCKEELQSGIHPEIAIKHTTLGSEGVRGKSVEELAYSALCMDVNYFILADLNGPEVLPFYKAATFGYIPWTIIRATSCQDALKRLVDMVVAAEPSIGKGIVSNNIASKFPIIVYMENKKVVDISMVTKDGYNPSDGTFILEKVPINQQNK